MVQGPRTLKSRDIKILRFWVLGFQGFATYPNFKVLGFQGLATIKILRSWVSKVSLHIEILRSWVSRALQHITILRSWVSRVPRQKGRGGSKVHQGPRPWTQRTQDLGCYWDLGTSLVSRARCRTSPDCRLLSSSSVWRHVHYSQLNPILAIHLTNDFDSFTRSQAVLRGQGMVTT